MDKLIVIPVTSDQSIELMLSLANEIWLEVLNKNSAIPPMEAKDILVAFTFSIGVRRRIRNGHYFIVQNIKKENIGYCGVYESNKVLFLDVIAVKAQHRAKRYGKRMLRVIEFVSKKYKYPVLMTTVHSVNSFAVDFFRRNGFVEQRKIKEKTDTEFVEKSLMIKNLYDSREKFTKAYEDLKYGKE
jgi:N-acetylglutamate synthase-like GNAT family acetyltransferase